jgi:predicted dehydrogenase
MDATMLKAIGKVALIGGGAIGRNHFGALIDCGVSLSDIVIVDQKEEICAEFRQEHPGVQAYTRWTAVPNEPLGAAIVAVNTPAHLTALQWTQDRGIKWVLCEKPLVMPNQLTIAFNLLGKDQTIFVGYQINFSQAVHALLEYMRSLKLHVVEGRSLWTKDRTSDQRPTLGDLADEATHAVAQLRRLVSVNQHVGRGDIYAALSFLPYANPEAQERVHLQYPSFPLEPISSSHLSLTANVRGYGPVLLSVLSSFVGFHQQRWIELDLANLAESEAITHMARLEFDTPNEDVLLFKKLGANGIRRYPFESRIKMQRQMEAFLTAAAGGAVNPYLTPLSEALALVEISAAATESHQLGRVIELDL